MRTTLLLLCGIVGVLLVACAGSPTRVDRSAAFGRSDFDALAGGTWKGTLTYLDYTSGKPTTIPSTLRVERAGDDAWRFATGYDHEPHADQASTLRLLDGGRSIQSGETTERVILRRTDAGVTEVITEYRGEDDARPATIRRAFRFASGEFGIRKLVKFDDAPDFLERHEYRWTRE